MLLNWCWCWVARGRSGGRWTDIDKNTKSKTGARCFCWLWLLWRCCCSVAAYTPRHPHHPPRAHLYLLTRACEVASASVFSLPLSPAPPPPAESRERLLTKTAPQAPKCPLRRCPQPTSAGVALLISMWFPAQWTSQARWARHWVRLCSAPTPLTLVPRGPGSNPASAKNFPT